MEARVGIDQVFQRSPIPPKPFGSGNFYKCCTDKKIISIAGLNQANNAEPVPTILSQSEHLWFPFWFP
jgi:hypothetical protein